MRGDARLVKKNPLYLSDYRGPDMEDIRYKPKMRCKYCGQDMEPYKSIGNAQMHRCYTVNCINNPDSPLKFDIDAAFINGAGNPALNWSPFDARKLC